MRHRGGVLVHSASEQAEAKRRGLAGAEEAEAAVAVLWCEGRCLTEARAQVCSSAVQDHVELTSGCLYAVFRVDATL